MNPAQKVTPGIASKHDLIATVVERDAFGQTSVRGVCQCGWTHVATGWTVSSTTENGVIRAHERHLREIEGQTTAGDKAVDAATFGLGLIVVLAIIASMIIIVFGLGKGVIGVFDGDDSPSDPDPQSQGPCPGLAKYLQNNDPDSATWQAVNDRFNRECLN